MHYQKLFWLFCVVASSCSLTERPSNHLALSQEDTAKVAEQLWQQNILKSAPRRELFPTIPEASGGAINIRNYGAKGDGITDDTLAFKSAIERDAIANQGKIIYIPNGTYLISDTIKWPKGFHAGLYYKRTTLLGESRQKTIIRLKDNVPTFSQGTPQSILDTEHNRANGFRNTIENLTINTGNGNKNAIGIKLNSNNGGGIFDVSILSEDGQGSQGLNLTGVEIGPLLIKNVAVKGFNTGILVGGGTTNSVHMENITLVGQNEVGLDQVMQTLTIRNLKSVHRGPAIMVRDHRATLTLAGADLNGIDNRSTAIETRYRAVDVSTPGERKTMQTFLSGVKQTGYQHSAKVYNCDTGNLETIAGNIDEWSCGKPLRGFSTQTKILNLSVKETPYLTHDLKNIAIVQGNSGASIQAAIDTPGVKTVFLPNRSYQVNQPIVIRGSVKKIIGMRAFFSDNSVHPIFRLADGDEPLVSIERLEEASLEHHSKRSLLIKHSDLQSYTNTPLGVGDLYLEDIDVNSVSMNRQKVWARSLNVEGIPSGFAPKILNNGGSLWILGLKTEQIGTILETKNQGSTNIVGGFIYINRSIPETQPPQAQYINNESQMSVLTRSYLPTATGYPVLVR